MSTKIQNTSLSIIFAFLPLSMILGSLIINLNILIFIILGAFLIFKEKLKINFSISNKSLIIFFVLMFFSTFINQDFKFNEYTAKSIFLFRFLILYIFFETLYKYDKIEIKLFYWSSLIFALIISIDILLYLYFDLNIFNIKSDPFFGFNSFFKEEKVAGGYILFALPLTILLFNDFFKRSGKNKIIECMIIFLMVSAIFVSSNKMSFVMTIFFLILVIIFVNRFRFQIIAALLFFLLSTSLIFEKDKTIYDRYESFFIHIYSVTDDSKESVIKSEFFTKKYSSSHGLIFMDSYEVFLEKKFIGGGLKSFRQNCPKLQKINKNCSTHPHNFVLEILNDTGLFGFIFSIIFSLLLLRDCIYKVISNRDSVDRKNFYLILLCFLFLIFWPIKSTGSIFSTFSGSFLWISICILSLSTFKKIKN